jgi:hypothetical protein
MAIEHARAHSLSQAGAHRTLSHRRLGLRATLGDIRCLLLITSESELIQWETITVWCGPPRVPQSNHCRAQLAWAYFAFQRGARHITGSLRAEQA